MDVKVSGGGGVVVVVVGSSSSSSNNNTSSKCRLCKQFHEAVEHIISACPMLAKEQYTETWLECVLN